jgi:hypothetical protein
MDALCLDWQDNGNISADATRDLCIEALANHMGVSTTEVTARIERRVTASQ